MPVETVAPSQTQADWADRACEVAFKHYQAGLPDEARQLCVRILEKLPNHGRTLYLLALIAVNSGDPKLALGLVEEALRSAPRVSFCHLLKGQILFRLKQYEQAAVSLEQSLQLRPRDPDALTALAHVRAAQEKKAEAVDLYERSLSLRPAHVETLIEFCTILRSVRRTAEAIGLYHKALQLSPANLTVLNNLALAYGESGRYEDAVPLLEQAVEHNPHAGPVRFNLAQAYSRLDRYEDAREQLEELSRRHPAMVEASVQMATVLFTLGRLEEGFRWNREHAHLARPCPDTHGLLLMSMHYDPSLTPAALFEEHRLWRRLHAPVCPPRPAVRASAGRIRVGYVSGDFRRHPVGWFMQPVLASHDPAAFEIYCYSVVSKPDDITTHAQSHSTWRDAFSWSAEKLARQIREDGIDILVDLAGYTAGNRLPVFAQRPAPVQVTWLGYPNTTGLEAIDYRLTDAWADPPGLTEHLNAEKLLRLPEGFLCYGTNPDSPAPSVPTGPVTFGCFNGLPKINDELLRIWARILDRVPGSRLYLKTRPLQRQCTREVILDRCRTAGIPPERLILEGFDGSHADHLAAYNKVDVALDTFPYNGTTTSYDALWMGVPVVGLEGPSHVSRVGVSILHRAGHPEWIGRTPEDYVDIAVRLADQPRPGLRSRLLTPAMTDGPAFTRTLETAYRDMLAEATAAPAPALDTEALRREVAAKPFWYHKIELPGGVVTPGWAPLSRDAYRVPADLTGKRVLDVGAWDGYWTFLALQRGAREVVAIDDFSDYLGSLKEADRRAWENFDLCRAALGYEETRCRRIEMSVYDATEERLGRFDVVFFFGTLYHLRHPLLALDRLSALCDGEIYVESAILDDFSPYRGGLGHGYPGQMVMEFYPDNQYGNNNTNWWAPSLQCLAHMVRAAGFAHADGWKLTDNPPGLPACRGFVRGTKHV